MDPSMDSRLYFQAKSIKAVTFGFVIRLANGKSKMMKCGFLDIQPRIPASFMIRPCRLAEQHQCLHLTIKTLSNFEKDNIIKALQ